MKRILVFLSLILLLCLCIPSAVYAQEKNETFIGGGVGLPPSEDHSISIVGIVGIPLSEDTLSFTDVDISVVRGTTIKQILRNEGLQYDIKTGLAYRLVNINKRLSLWGLGDAGLAVGGPSGLNNQTVISGSFGGGGFLRYKISDLLDGAVILQVEKNSATKNTFFPKVILKIKL